jgi:CubicO group peptidase (beta-lactamase class C family)
VKALEQVEQWPAETVAVGVIADGRVTATRGPEKRGLRWASVTKPVAALAVLVAAEEGTLDLDEPAGPPGSTVRHLLAHASGLPFEGREPIAPPGRRRIYSNSGFDVLAETVEAHAELPFETYLRAAVLEPLQLGAELRGPAGSGLVGDLRDLLTVGRELLAPTLVAFARLEEATTVQFPGLSGVIPELGRFDPNDWGLGFELRDDKPGHFSGTRASPRTFGHWGGAGTFLWVDPHAAVACACITDLAFGDWAKEAWPRLSDAVLEELSQ